MRDIKMLFTDTSVSARYKTDRLFRAPDMSLRYDGELDYALRWLERRHIVNPKMWRVFVEQYFLYSDDDNGWRGEFWGKMMRAAVSVYVYTGDEGLYACLEDTVREMLTAQDEFGRFSTYSIAVEFRDWDIWCRKYVMLGMQYFYDICRDEALKSDIKKALMLHTDYLISKIGTGEGKRSITQSGFAHLKGINASSLLEPVVRMYQLTGETRYLDFASYIVSAGGLEGENIFELAFEGRVPPYKYSCTKGYEMISCFEGLVEYYRVTKNQKYLIAAENFARLIAETELTALGGLGCEHEMFDNSAKSQTDLDIKEAKQETCTAVTWLKYCMQLLFLTGKPIYADYMELTARNLIMGAVNTEECHFDFEHHPIYLRFCMHNYSHNGIDDHGMPFDSYSPTTVGFRGANIGGFRIFRDAYYKTRDMYYGCCGAAGGIALGIMANTSICYTESGIVFNDYYAGKAQLSAPNGERVGFDIETEYPRLGEIKITLNNSADTEIAFRIPTWSRNTAVFLNGEAVKAESGEYLKLSRSWKKGDVIEISLDMRAKATVQDGLVSISRGPLKFALDEALCGNADGEYALKIDNDGFIDASLSQIKSDKYICLIDIPLKNDEKLTLCDYSSAGKVWSKENKIAAWFKLLQR